MFVANLAQFCSSHRLKFDSLGLASGKLDSLCCISGDAIIERALLLGALERKDRCSFVEKFAWHETSNLIV